MQISTRHFTLALGLGALLVIAVLALTGHCSFNVGGNIGIGVR